MNMFDNVWRIAKTGETQEPQTSPLNKVQIVKDILANADFADTEKYFLSNAAPAGAEPAGIAQTAPALGDVEAQQ